MVDVVPSVESKTPYKGSGAGLFPGRHMGSCTGLTYHLVGLLANGRRCCLTSTFEAHGDGRRNSLSECGLT